MATPENLKAEMAEAGFAGGAEARAAAGEYAAGTGAKSHRPQDDGHCVETLFSTWTGRFPAGIATGDA